MINSVSWVSVIILLLIMPGLRLQAQFGCTDVQASNYNPTAIKNDGSCIYPYSSYDLKQIATLPKVLEECSGLSYFNQMLWAILDSGNPARVYNIDTLSADLLQSTSVQGASNEDWEDLTEDKDFVYIGDFGNNQGNRKNLRVIKIRKSGLTSGNLSPEYINFSFSDQTSFNHNQNAHDFDCEALFYFKDSLHLFSKNWVDNKTRHYVLPSTPGNYVAQPKESFDVQGLITGAAINENGTAVLLGYNSFTTEAFLWLMYDYPGTYFFNGNKRKISLGSTLFISRPEGVAFRNGTNGYICSEPVPALSAQLLSFDLSQWISKIVSTVETKDLQKFAIYPNPAYGKATLVFFGSDLGKAELSLHDAYGRKIWQQVLPTIQSGKEFILDFSGKKNPKGIYLLTLRTQSGLFSKKLLIE